MNLKSIIKEQGLEPFGRFYGVYAGRVVDDQDPDHMGRLILYIPELFGKRTVVATPFGMYSGVDHGSYLIPAVGTYVYVQFVNGDPKRPIWAHSGPSKDNLPEEFSSPWVSGYKSLNGYVFTHDDQTGVSQYKGENITLRVDDKNSEVSIEGKGGTKIRVDDKTGKIELTSSSGESIENLLKDFADLLSPSVSNSNTMVSDIPNGYFLSGVTLPISIRSWKNRVSNLFKSS